MKKGLTVFGALIVLVLVAALGMGCIDKEDIVDTSALDGQIADLQAQIADMIDQGVADALEAEHDAAMAELQAQIDELMDELEDVQEFPYTITKRYETELNESFDARGLCGGGAHQIKLRAEQSANYFVEYLEDNVDNVGQIEVVYQGSERTFEGVNETVCIITFYYDVEWVEYEYEDIVIYR